MSGPIETSRRGDVVTVTLNRPEAGNAVDLETARALHRAVVEAEASGALVMVLAARGKVFCAGGDVVSMAESADPGAHLDELAGAMHEALAAMSASPVFVVAAIDGAAAGGGLGLALTADYLVATPRASFLTAYAGVGLTPDSGVSSLLVRSVGMHRALALASSGRVLSAEEARDWGIVAEVVASEELADVVARRAETFARTVGPALGETKRLIRSATETAYVAQLADEQQTIAEAATTPHAQERIRRFVERSAAQQAN
ncbi:MAG: enoyl-CoA hydratase/isomerase family protein [Salinibacterium sp.]|nr:enoyl-CoA hydratase/isomerase family protein [Salinibacterium sp.]MBF0673339.1 enoyl-CoA hydratase/isomerase family protein [Salinibacterium sp.]